MAKVFTEVAIVSSPVTYHYEMTMLPNGRVLTHAKEGDYHTRVIDTDNATYMILDSDDDGRNFMMYSSTPVMDPAKFWRLWNRVCVGKTYWFRRDKQKATSVVNPDVEEVKKA